MKKVFSQFKYDLLYGGLDAIAFDRISDKMTASNRRSLCRFSLISVAFFALMFIGSLLIPSISAYKVAYFAGFCITGIMWWVAEYPAKKHKKLVDIDASLFIFFLLCTGIAMGTVLSPNELATTFIAFLIAVPTLFTNRPFRIHLLIIVSVVIFIIMAINYKNPATLASDIVNAIIFGALSIVITTFTITNRLKRYELEASIRFLAENDAMTALKNRFSYEAYIAKAELKEPENFYCIYIDANGLHALNDTEGHAAGDIFLCAIADELRRLFGEEDSYRIGGDEFVVMGTDKSFDEASALIAQLKQTLEEKDYYISAGVACKTAQDEEIITIIKDAELKMYDDKELYYLTSGKDRRR